MHFRLARAVICLQLLFLIPIDCRAQTSRESKIWDRTIATQPFDKTPFRQINVPEWVQETTGVGYTFSVMNAEQRRKATAAGVTISELGFVDPFYAYYDSRLLAKRSPHMPLDRIDKDVAEYKRLGVR